MDVVGSEIGQKMRSAIKAKLTELGCYVDDELPDYVMVMVANKRTRAQMEDDLLLFLGDNTELFVNWLHQVLKKLQEVTVTAPIKPTECDKGKERSKSKEKKSKTKKAKDKIKKSDGSKKTKKKEKEKLHRKKEEKKIHKSKKKSKHHEMIRPNIPPLLMNIEKESEPSITDVFAGQILKNHGILLDPPREEPKTVDLKPILTEPKRPIVPIIDPATISSQPEPSLANNEDNQNNTEETTKRTSVSSIGAPREEQIKEINKIEARIQGLKQKLEEQLDDPISDDEDFLNIRTEAEELMNDFVEDVFQEISQPAPMATPPLHSHNKSSSPSPPVVRPPEFTAETLPQIELKLPRRPVRERLGAREEPKAVPETKENNDQQIEIPDATDKRIESPERFTPEREPEFRPHSKSAKSRLGDHPEPQKRSHISEDTATDKLESSSKRLTSKVSSLEARPSRGTCASVVRVRPRPRVAAPASSLLLRAVADAHRSLLNIPPKVDPEPQKVKRALVLPMRRCVDAQKIVIQVPGGDTARIESRDDVSISEDSEMDDKTSKVASDTADKDEHRPIAITKKITNTEYVPLHCSEERNASRQDDNLTLETINIHNPTVDKEKGTQFIVTMDGYHPNVFLAKKLMTEGLLDDEVLDTIKPKENATNNKAEEKDKETTLEKQTPEIDLESPSQSRSEKKRLSDTSEESDTHVIIKQEKDKTLEGKRKNSEMSIETSSLTEETPPCKKRKASPIVFDVDKKEKLRQRERTESASSDNHVTVTTTTSSHKYDSLPPLSQAVPAVPQVERKPVPCRAFPLCRYGAACAFTHPRCKFGVACTRRNCVYTHPSHARTLPPAPVAPVLASHVVPAANYKSISAVGLPNICKYYPNCVNPACHYYHPKPCRYGMNCINKLECNFYHSDVPAGKWMYPM